MPYPTHQVYVALEVLASILQHEKISERHTVRKEGVKLFLFTDDMISYKENYHRPTNKQTENTGRIKYGYSKVHDTRST